MAHPTASLWNQPARGSSNFFNLHNSFNPPRTGFDRSQLPTYPRSNSVDSVMGDVFQTQPKRPKFDVSFSRDTDYPFLSPPPRDRAVTPPDHFSLNSRFQFERDFFKRPPPPPPPPPLFPSQQQESGVDENVFCIPGLGGDSPNTAKENNSAAVPFSFNQSQFETGDSDNTLHYLEPHVPDSDPDFDGFEARRWQHESVPRTFQKNVFEQANQPQEEQKFGFGNELWRDPNLQRLAREEMERERTRVHEERQRERSWSECSTSNQFSKQDSGGRTQWDEASPRQQELNCFQVPSFGRSPQRRNVVPSPKARGSYSSEDCNVGHRSGQWVGRMNAQSNSQQSEGVGSLSVERVNALPIYDQSLEEQKCQDDEINRIRQIGRFAQKLEQRSQHTTRRSKTSLKRDSKARQSATAEAEAKRLREENERLRELLKEKDVLSQESVAKLSSVQDQVLQWKEEEERRFREEAERVRKAEFEQKIRDKVIEMREREKRISLEQQLLADKSSESSSLNVSLAPTPRSPSPVEPLPLFPHVNPSPVAVVANSNLVRPHPLFSPNAAQVPDVSTTQPTSESSSLSSSSFSFNLEAYSAAEKQSMSRQSLVKRSTSAAKSAVPTSQPRPLVQVKASSRVQSSYSSKPPSLMEISTASPIKRTAPKPPSLMEIDTSPIKRTLNKSASVHKKSPPYEHLITKAVPKHTLQSTPDNLSLKVKSTLLASKKTTSVHPQGKPSPRQPQSQTISFNLRTPAADKDCHFEPSHLQRANSQRNSESVQCQGKKATTSGTTLNKQTQSTSAVRKKEFVKDKVVSPLRSGKGQSQEKTASASSSGNLLLPKKTSTPSSSFSSSPGLPVQKRIIKLKRSWKKNPSSQAASNVKDTSSQSNSKPSLNTFKASNSRALSNKETTRDYGTTLSSSSLWKPTTERTVTMRQSPLLATRPPQHEPSVREDETTPNVSVSGATSTPQFDCHEMERKDDVGHDEAGDDEELQIHPELNEFEEDTSFEIGRSQPIKKKLTNVCSVVESRSVERDVRVSETASSNSKERKREVLEKAKWEKKQSNRYSVPSQKPIPTVPGRSALFKFMNAHHGDRYYDRSGYHGDYYRGNYQGAYSSRSSLSRPNPYRAPPLVRPYFNPPVPPRSHYFYAPY